MNIFHFESHIAEIILSRGYDYYVEGHVVDAYCPGNNEYIFQVQGSDDYEVVVGIDENGVGNIVYSSCDCPYIGPVCKHEVASYYKLAEILNSENKGNNVPIPQWDLSAVLNALPKEELVRMIMDIARKDAVLRNRIMVNYSKASDGNQLLFQFQKLIDAIVKKYTAREGFIRYRDVGEFAREMGEVYEKVRDTDQAVLALDMACNLLAECIEAFQYADDSDGDIGSLVDEVLDVIRDIVIASQDLEVSEKECLFNKLLEMSDDPCFEGWDDYKIELLDICVGFGDDESFRNRLKLKIESIT